MAGEPGSGTAGADRKKHVYRAFVSLSLVAFVFPTPTTRPGRGRSRRQAIAHAPSDYQGIMGTSGKNCMTDSDPERVDLWGQ